MAETFIWIIFTGIGVLFLLIAVALFLSNNNKQKKYSETAVGTVIEHRWGHTDNHSYPYPVLSYNVGGIDYTRKFTYSSISYNSFKHAEADWMLDDNYGLHMYVTRKCDRHINPMEEWFPLGSTMPVYYHPDKPWKSYCGGLVNLKLVGIIMGGIGMLFTIIGILLLLFLS